MDGKLFEDSFLQALLDNPFANLPGPFFLLFYGALTVIFILIAWRTAKASDTSDKLPALPVPENPNPYEAAFLRGGSTEVGRLIIVELFHRGILVQTPFSWFRKTKLKLADGIELSSLDPTTRRFAEHFIQPVVPEVLTSVRVREVFKDQLDRWTKWARDEQLVFEPGFRKAISIFGTSLILFFLAIGAYKLLIAVNKHHYNVGFLIALGVIGTVSISYVMRLPKFTKRGRRYVQDLQTAYQNFKQGALPKPEKYEPTSGTAAWDPMLAASFAMPVMAMGVFGITALGAAEYKYLYDRFAMYPCGSACGAGCGAGSSCGSCGSAGAGGGCGSGCGGCGGCGS